MTAVGHSEASEVKALEKNASWTVGSIGYLVSTAWWSAWLQYSSYTGPDASSAPSLLQLPGGGGPRPGPISNADLLPPGHSAAKPQLPGAATSQSQTQTQQPAAFADEDLPLRPGLVEQRDFVVVSAATWQRLHSWYGGGPAIARRVVTEATSGTATAALRGRLVLYPLRLEVCYKARDGKERSAVVAIDPETSLATLKARACTALGVAESEVVLWDYTGGRPVQSMEAAPPPGEVADAVEVISVAGTTQMAVEDGTPVLAAAGGTDGGRMDVDAAAPAAAKAAAKAGVPGGVLGRAVREVPLLDGQLLGLRRKDAGTVSYDADDEDDEDACGSDHENDTGPPSGKKQVGRRAPTAAAGTTPAAAAAAAAARRASAAGSSRSDGGSGTGAAVPPATARTTGGSSAPLGNNRLGSQRPSWGALEDHVIPRDGQAPGLAGLSNLGNTCFMNSSLQCLAHAVPLMEAFLGGAYLQDLNRTNPLGMKGELAEAFGALLEQLWRGGLSAVTPRSFKAKIGRFAPQFSGYAQHDSQEFLAFLLDGLHEDTNRIQNKPYIEEKDQSGRPDEEVAAEAWANYRARNDSLVVDHFQGLFKSTVDCPQCGFNSVKFDPFMYLSLPLPESRRRVAEVVLVHTDGGALPCRMALELPSGAALLDLLRAAASAGGLPAEAVAAPETHLLAARPLRGVSATNDELVLLTDCRMRVADALDTGGSVGSSYNLRGAANGADSALVVYYYPDPAKGPRGEALAPVIVHFKRPDSRRAVSWNRGVWCGAPLVLYMREGQPPYDPANVTKVPLASGPSSRSEWEISGDCPLAAALREVLRPIQGMAIATSPPPPPAASATDAVQAAEEAPQGPCTGEPPPPAPSVAPGAGAVAVPQSPATTAAVAVAGSAHIDEDGDGPVIAAPDAVVIAVAGGGGSSSGDEALRPGTPGWDGDQSASAGGGGGGEALRRRRGSDDDEAGAAAACERGVGDKLMEGLETPAPSGADAVPAVPASGLAGGDASMPGTPQPAAWDPMEDDVLAGGPALPAVFVAGPPEEVGADVAAGLGPPGVQPFDMWAAQSAWGGDDVASAATVAGPSQQQPAPSAAASGLLTGPPFSLKLCNSKGDSTLWGGTYDKDINPEHHREFLLLFSEVCATAAADGTAAGPYAAELLDTPHEHPSLREHRRRAAAGPQPVSLNACMATFLQPERLAESDAWYCPRCKSHVCADKKLDLWSLPEVLVVHLKRFNYTRYSRNKLDTRVDFPLHGLDLGLYVMRPQAVPPLYDLFAVSNHYGSMGGGHYTAYAKLPSPPPESPAADDGGAAAAVGAAASDRWYCFDDSHVSPVDPDAVRSPAAYVLFYRRRAEAAADPPDVGQLLVRLRRQRAELQPQADDSPAARSPGAAGLAGSANPGSDRRADNDQEQDQDQDQDQGSRGGTRRGCGPLGDVSIAAAAAAAAVSIAAAAEAARGGAGAGGGDNAEELEVQGRSMAAFSLGSRDPAAAVASGHHHRSAGGRGGAGTGSSESYGDVDGAAVVGPPSPMPISTGNTYCGAAGEHMPYVGFGSGGGGGKYDPSDYGAFVVEDVGGAAGGRGVCGSVAGGGGGDGDGGSALLQPPGSPVEPDLDLNNADLSGLYKEVDAMDVVRERHSGSDVDSAGDNDLDMDVNDNDHEHGDEGDDWLGPGPVRGEGGVKAQVGGRRGAAGAPPCDRSLHLMATSPPL